MELELIYETKDDIPSGYEALFTERDGKWHLTGVKGIKTQGDIDRLQTALTKERNDHKKTKETLQKFGNHDAEQLANDLDELEELRALKESGGLGNGASEEKINALVEQRIQRKLAPLQRELEKTKTKLAEAEGQVNELSTEKKRTKISSVTSAVARELKVLDTAVDDVILYAERLFELDDSGNVVARDGVGLAPGMTPKEWLADMQKARPHWWPASQGGGGRGDRGGAAGDPNPWTKEHWSITAQGEYVKKHGEAKARAAAEAVGSKLGATKPPA